MRIDSSTFWGSLRIGCGLFPGDPSLRAEVIAVIEHMFADRRGIWQVSIIGSQDRAAWYIKVTGPNAFERSYTLERAAGQQRVEVIQRRCWLAAMSASQRSTSW